MKRVSQLLICPHYQGSEYDESKYNGHAVEAVLEEHLKKYGFQPQVEIKYREVVGHPDFMAERDNYIEVIEVKNTAGMKYLHLLQLAAYKSMLYKIYNKPVLGYLTYIKFETVFGEAPTRPAWVPSDWKYIHIDIDSGEHYVNWLRFRSTYSSRIAGPYCISCRADCKLKFVILNGPSNKSLLEAEPQTE